MITYSSNWMGPVNTEWYRERGLINQDNEVIEYYSAGRIDIRDDSKEGYDGWDEYSVAPMHGEDWNALSDWLDDLETDELMSYGDLIESFQLWYGKSIRWADDIWYKCYECQLVTDLRKYPKTHKMGCTRKWDKDYE